MSDEDFAALVCVVVGRLSFADERLAAPVVKNLRDALALRGHGPGCHAGRKDIVPQSAECVEWYAGQLLEIIDREAWYAMNSAINVLAIFVPVPR